MAVNYDTNIQTALQRCLSRVKITLSNWGNKGSTADLQSTVTAPQNYSLAGLALDPSSEVRSVLIQSPKNWGSTQLITPTTPFVGEIPGPWTATADPGGDFANFYFPSGTNTLTTFGPNMGLDPAGTEIFGGGSVGFPNCVLIGYLRPTEVIAHSSNRLLDETGSIAVAGGETLRVYAIPYRMHGRVFAKIGQNTDSLKLIVTTAPGGDTANIVEDTSIGGSVTITGANNEGVIYMPDLVGARWLFIKIGDVAGLAPSVLLRVEIE